MSASSLTNSEPASSHFTPGRPSATKWGELSGNAVLYVFKPTGDPEAGSGSRIDVHSASRHGRSDLGVNAARIRTYLTALQEAEKPGN